MAEFLRVEGHSQAASMKKISEIAGAHLVADRINPRSDGSPRGRHTVGTSCSGSLPRTVHDLFPLPFPPSQPATALAGGHEHINPRPDLGGRATPQMLMGPEVIVDRLDVLQGSITRGGIVDRMHGEQLFHRADEPLDAAVLPGAARLAVLQENPHTRQRQTKRLRGEHRFVVGAQESRAAVLTADGDELAPDRPRRLVGQPLDTQASPAGMIDDRQRQMLSAMGIGVGQQVHPPNQIARHRTRHAMFQAPSCTEDGVLLASNCVGDVGFADGHLSTDREAPVEGVHDRAAARMGHEGFQANQFIAHPTWFGRRVGSSRGTTGAGTRPERPRPRAHPSMHPVPQIGTPSNEPMPYTQHRAPLSHSCVIDRIGTS